MMNAGKLTLVPLPIDDESLIAPDTKAMLEQAWLNKELILVEEARPCRRRWLHYGLPREAIADFIIYNEHEREELAPQMLSQLKAGKNIYLMSDCGLPAFCDPGTELVDLCHKNAIQVSASTFSNSTMLAIALSGFPNERFIFEGFLPKKSPDRIQDLKRILKAPEMSVLMDTPYRLKNLLEELEHLNCQRKIFLALNLNSRNELLLRGQLSAIREKVTEKKHEFILIIGPKNV